MKKKLRTRSKKSIDDRSKNLHPKCSMNQIFLIHLFATNEHEKKKRREEKKHKSCMIDHIANTQEQEE